MSALLVIGGALVGYFAATSDPVLAHALWPSVDPRQPGSTPEQLLDHLRHGRDESGGEKFFFASFLFQHNLKVALLAMATGVLASVPTVFLMIFNGMLLGVFAAIHHEAGIRAEMWAWILPHGITELGAIMLCGGVGLMLGQAVVRPGMLSRTQSLLAGGTRGGADLPRRGRRCWCSPRSSRATCGRATGRRPTRLVFAAATAVFWVALYCARFLPRAASAACVPSKTIWQRFDRVTR